MVERFFAHRTLFSLNAAVATVSTHLRDTRFRTSSVAQPHATAAPTCCTDECMHDHNRTAHRTSSRSIRTAMRALQLALMSANTRCHRARTTPIIRSRTSEVVPHPPSRRATVVARATDRVGAPRTPPRACRESNTSLRASGTRERLDAEPARTRRCGRGSRENARTRHRMRRACAPHQQHTGSVLEASVVSELLSRTSSRARRAPRPGSPRRGLLPAHRAARRRGTRRRASSRSRWRTGAPSRRWSGRRTGS